MDKHKIAERVLPPKIYESLRLLKSRYVSNNEKSVLERNRTLQGIHAGKSGYILATGPSINSLDLKSLKDEICIAVSCFYLHPDYSEINPKYHCLSNGPTHGVGADEYLAMLKAADQYVRDAIVLTGIAERERIEANKLFSANQVFFMKYGSGNPKFIRNGIDLTRAILAPMSVVIVAMQAAIYMGFKDIYLIGFDHNWFINRAQRYAIEHFYPESKSAIDQMHHQKDSTFSIELQAAARLWGQHEILKELAGAANVKIWNATLGSFLDVFPHVSLDL